MNLKTTTGKTIHDGQTVAMADLIRPFSADWPEMNHGSLFTVALWNATSKNAPDMHFLAINVPTSGRIVIPYKAPQSTHDLYQFEVLQQASSFPVYSAPKHDHFQFPINWKFLRRVGIIKFRVSDHAKIETNGHAKMSKEDYFRSGHDLTASEEKFCRCTLHVMAKQPEDCLAAHNWGRGKPCYNPYSVCARSTGTSVGRSDKCTRSYNFEGIPDNELKAYAIVEGVRIPVPYDRTAMVDILDKWRSSKGM